MNRKEFLNKIWNKGFKPILLFVAAALCFHFLYRAFFESGNERNILILMTALAFFYMLMYILGRLFQNVLERLFLKIPDAQRRILRRVHHIISPIIFVYLIYVSWQKDQVLTLIVLSILLVEYLLRRRAFRSSPLEEKAVEIRSEKGSTKKKTGLLFLSILILGFVVPQNFSMPVEGAKTSDYNKKSFWYYPWGKSVTHKGVDIFAKEGTLIRSSTSGLVLFRGQLKFGGNVVLIIGPKWRLHYYAHLKEVNTTLFSWTNRNEHIGTVGTSGNAAGKAPHLHYSIVTPIPYLWRVDKDRQGWKKMFYLNPIDYLENITP